ncbi:MAG: LysM peptidoglycan-binding domain-containing protein [Crocinitomicaceae bacterium]|nr:LysM peptidoglycan-binding domain-containing protein [Crocinitomicaceae bacterium]
MKKLLFYLLLATLVPLLSACSSSAQITAPIEKINGKEFYIHKVEKGQTLFSLAKMYKCDVNDVLSANPGSDAGIKEGQVIKIPMDKSGVKSAIKTDTGETRFRIHEVQRKETLYSIAKQYDLDVNEIVANNPGTENGLNKGQQLKIPYKQKKSDAPVVIAVSQNVKHIIQPGETLFSISKLYNVPVDAILRANAGMNESLKAGQEIFIPTVSESEKIVVEDHPIPDQKVAIYGPLMKDSYRIALMLPFFSQYADTSVLSEREIRQREVAIDIYRGAMMAKDSLEQSGLNASLYIYDVQDDKSGMLSLLGNPDLNNSDLIIGPLFREPFSAVASWGRKSGAHIVCPVPISNRVLLSANNVSKAYPGEATQWESFGNFVAKHYPSANVITVNTSDLDDIKLLNAFNLAFIKMRGDSAKEFKAINGSATGISKLLVEGKTNVLIVPSNDRLLITTLFKNISGDNIIVYGTEDWENLSLIETEARNEFHLHYPKVIFLDYSDSEDQGWIEAYRRKFKAEPTDFSVLGYDIMQYYGTGLRKFGRDFPNHFSEIDQKQLVGSSFDYFKTGNESGFENRHIFVLGTDNFELIPEK